MLTHQYQLQYFYLCCLLILKIKKIKKFNLPKYGKEIDFFSSISLIVLKWCVKKITIKLFYSSYIRKYLQERQASEPYDLLNFGENDSFTAWCFLSSSGAYFYNIFHNINVNLSYLHKFTWFFFSHFIWGLNLFLQ